MMIGTKKVISDMLVTAIVCGCLGVAAKRLIYVYKHFDLQGLINHEKNSK